MLTRIEIDGFKNLLNFELDFGPFTCIAGPNGSGKSNIFDAIEFLSHLSDKSLMEAALKIRGGTPETADLADIFWRDAQDAQRKIHIAIEMIVDPDITDDFGRPCRATSTFLRYEVELGYEPPGENSLLGRLFLEHESLQYIPENIAYKKLLFPHRAEAFRRSIVSNSRRSKSGYISTENASDGTTEILVHADGGSRGSPQKSPARDAPRTIVATSNTSSTPTILAVRRELQNWRVLALEPSAMRSADRFYDDPNITESGDHIPATLHRLKARNTRKNDQSDALAEISKDLAQFVPVTGIDVNRDEARQLLTMHVIEKSGLSIPARSVSDGTLRFLVLSIMSHDPLSKGVYCMEEPENGIHPAKIDDINRLLNEMAVDPETPPGEENPMRQMIIATHSPLLVQVQNPDDVVFASAVRIKRGEGIANSMRCRPLHNSWRCSQEEKGVGKLSVISYLTTAPGAQIKLDFEI